MLFYAAIVKGKWKRLLNSSEFKLYSFLVLAFTLFIMLELILHRSYDIEHAFRSSLFTVVSFITTTGLFNDDAGTWPHVTWIVLALCMFIGGMSGRGRGVG